MSESNVNEVGQGGGGSAWIRGEESRTPPSVDALFDALSTERRREVVSMLATRGEPLRLGALAERLDDGADDQRTRLVHVDLPKLVDADLARFDVETRAVAPTPWTDAAARHVSLAASEPLHR